MITLSDWDQGRQRTFNVPCRDTGLCHLDDRRKWELFYPGSTNPRLERLGFGLLVVVTDFIAQFVRRLDEGTHRDGFQITFSSRNARPSAIRS